MLGFAAVAAPRFSLQYFALRCKMISAAIANPLLINLFFNRKNHVPLDTREAKLIKPGVFSFKYSVFYCQPSTLTHDTYICL